MAEQTIPLTLPDDLSRRLHQHVVFQRQRVEEDVLALSTSALF